MSSFNFIFVFFVVSSFIAFDAFFNSCAPFSLIPRILLKFHSEQHTTSKTVLKPASLSELILILFTYFFNSSTLIVFKVLFTSCNKRELAFFIIFSLYVEDNEEKEVNMSCALFNLSDSEFNKKKFGFCGSFSI